MAHVRRHPGAVRRAVQHDRRHRGPDRPELAVARPVVRAADRVRPVPVGPGHEPRAVRLRAERGTSPASLLAAQAHLGSGISPAGPLHGWDGAGALTPISRFATMLSGLGVGDADGTEWYFPMRLTIDSGAVANGDPNPAQRVLGVERDARPPPAETTADLRVRCAARRRRRARRRRSARGAVGDSADAPPADRPPEHLRPQRPGRRVPEERVLRGADAVPGASAVGTASPPRHPATRDTPATASPRPSRHSGHPGHPGNSPTPLVDFPRYSRGSGRFGCISDPNRPRACAP